MSSQEKHQILKLQCQNVDITSNATSSFTLIEQDNFQSLLAKESSSSAKGYHNLHDLVKKFPSFADSRYQAVDWMLKVHDFYSFSAHTVILAVNYFDRFFALFGVSDNKPWMIQLAAVACLSLSAKMEEILVPLLVDFQVVDAKYVFEAKTIQKTEILILSTLHWEMNAATPMSFIEHMVIIGHGFTGYEIYITFEDLLLRALSDVDFVNYRPSVIAAAVMLNTISTLQPCEMTRARKQILDMHKYDKMELEDCCHFLQHLSSNYHRCRHNKRSFSEIQDSPKGVLDAAFSSEASNESWASPRSTSSSLVSISKRIKIHQMQENQNYQ